MNRILKVGDRVKIKRIRQHTKELINSLEEYPVEVVEVSEAWSGGTRYRIELHNVLNVQGTNVVKWVDEDDITLDIEYYRNLNLEKILYE